MLAIFTAIAVSCVVTALFIGVAIPFLVGLFDRYDLF